MPKKPGAKKGKEPVGLYAVDIMKDNELRSYAEALQKEIKRLKIDYNQIQKEKKRLADLWELREDELAALNKELIVKDVEMSNLKMTWDKQEYRDERLSKLMGYNYAAELEAASEEMSKFKFDIKAREESTAVQKNFERQDEKRELRLDFETTALDMKERRNTTIGGMTKEVEEFLQSTATENLESLLKYRQDFNEEKEAEMAVAWEGKTLGKGVFDEDCEAYLEKMQMYFQEISWKNRTIIDALQDELSKLQRDTELVWRKLRSTRMENKKLSAAAEEKLEDIELDSYPAKQVTETKSVIEELEKKQMKNQTKLRKLAATNAELIKDIKQVMKDGDVLRDQFMLAQKRVRDRTERKNNFLEEKVDCLSTLNCTVNRVVSNLDLES